MNLELPFYEVPAADVHDYLARMENELDALFLGEVERSLGRLRSERAVADNAPAVAVAASDAAA